MQSLNLQKLKLILASTSTYRSNLLSRLGIPFECVDPGVNEEKIKTGGFSPRTLCEKLALLKASTVYKSRANSLVIGGDQMVNLEGEILGKPETPDVAILQLMKMSGKVHELVTSTALVDEDGEFIFTDIARLRMRALSQNEIERYVDADRPLNCAGSYKLETMGIALFDSIECQDHTAIVGLPLLKLAGYLRKKGFQIP